MPESLGTLFLAAALSSGDTATYLRCGPIGHLFRNTEHPVYVLVDEHVRAHGKLPSPQTVSASLKVDLPAPVEPASFYLDLLRKRHVDLELRRTVDAANEKMKAQDPMGALQVFADRVYELVQQDRSADLMDLRYSGKLVWPEYLQQASGLDVGIRLGWPTLDEMSGGIRAGDLVSIVGRPAMGKTQNLLFSATSAWRHHQKSVLFVSMEMSNLLIAQRFVAMEAHIPLMGLKTGLLSKGTGASQVENLKTVLKQLETAKVPFYSVDAQMSHTVEEIFALCQQLQPAVVYVDGAYLLQARNARDRYTRVAENCDALKRDVAGHLGIPVVASWQLSREAAKKKKAKKGEAVDLEDIAYSDAIGQHSSIILGLFEEESVETIIRRRVEIMKGRSGEKGQFFVRWDFEKMNFTEIESEEPVELTYGI